MKRLAWVLLVGSISCSTNTPAGDGGSGIDGWVVDASPDGSGAPDGGVSCTYPDNAAAPDVTVTETTATAPAPMGGTPLPGLYHLTEYNYYYNRTGTKCCVRIAMRVSPDTILQSRFFTTSGAYKVGVRYSISGTTLENTAICSTLPGDARNWPFTVSGTTIKLYDSSGGTDEMIFARVGD